MLYLRTLCIVWSLVRCRVTRRLIRLQTMYNVLKFSEKWWNNDKNQFTGNGVQLHRNRKYFKFNNAHDCTSDKCDHWKHKEGVFVCWGANFNVPFPIFFFIFQNCVKYTTLISIITEYSIIRYAYLIHETTCLTVYVIND